MAIPDSKCFGEGVVANSLVCPGTMVSGTDQWSLALEALETMVAINNIG